MRWQLFVAALAMTACVWAEGAEDKPAPAPESLDDPALVLRALERDEAVVRETLHKIGQELDINRSDSVSEKDAEKRNALLRRNQSLNELRQVNQIRLNELMSQLREKQAAQLRQAFGQECTLTITTAPDKEPTRIAGIGLARVLNVAGRQMLQFRNTSDGTLWTVDPQRIVMAQVTK